MGTESNLICGGGVNVATFGTALILRGSAGWSTGDGAVGFSGAGGVANSPSAIADRDFESVGSPDEGPLYRGAAPGL
jgi:hypothetical protein